MYDLGYSDMSRADSAMYNAMLATAMEAPIGQDTLRCATDAYWAGVYACSQDEIRLHHSFMLPLLDCLHLPY